jgi:hypothetical protein
MDEPTQSAEPTTEAKRSRGLASYLVWGFGIVVLYILSFGPAVFLQISGTLGPSTYAVYFYRPWNWAYRHTPLHKPLGIYLHLWAPSFYDKNGDTIPIY